MKSCVKKISSSTNLAPEKICVVFVVQTSAYFLRWKKNTSPYSNLSVLTRAPQACESRSGPAMNQPFYLHPRRIRLGSGNRTKRQLINRASVVSECWRPSASGSVSRKLCCDKTSERLCPQWAKRCRHVIWYRELCHLPPPRFVLTAESTLINVSVDSLRWLSTLTRLLWLVSRSMSVGGQVLLMMGEFRNWIYAVVVINIYFC